MHPKQTLVSQIHRTGVWRPGYRFQGTYMPHSKYLYFEGMIWLSKNHHKQRGCCFCCDPVRLNMFKRKPESLLGVPGILPIRLESKKHKVLTTFQQITLPANEVCSSQNMQPNA